MDDFGIDMDPEPGSSVMGQRIEDEYNFEVLYGADVTLVYGDDESL